MSYASRDDLAKRWGSDWLPQKVANDGAVSEDTERINAALADASAMIDSYIGTRYQVPLSVASDFVKSLTCDIVRGLLMQCKTLAASQKKLALKTLQTIKDGQLDLVGLTPTKESAFAESQKQQYSQDTII